MLAWRPAWKLTAAGVAKVTFFAVFAHQSPGEYIPVTRRGIIDLKAPKLTKSCAFWRSRIVVSGRVGVSCVSLMCSGCVRCFHLAARSTQYSEKQTNKNISLISFWALQFFQSKAGWEAPCRQRGHQNLHAGHLMVQRVVFGFIKSCFLTGWRTE